MQSLGILASSTAPLRDAVAVMAADGHYIPALAQSAFLQAYGNATLTNEMLALADVYRRGGAPDLSGACVIAAGPLETDADEVVLAAAR